MNLTACSPYNCLLCCSKHTGIQAMLNYCLHQRSLLIEEPRPA